MSCRPSDIIKASQIRERLRHQDGDTHDIIAVIMDMDAQADKHIMPAGEECLRGLDDEATMRNVWKFVKSNVQYRADRAGHEKVQSPAALFARRVGDCKSFSIAEAALMRALGFKNIYYRFAAYPDDQGRVGDYTHVYVVVKQDGREYILDAVHDRPFEEVAFARKMDKKAAPGAIAGIGAPPTATTANGLKWALGILLILLIAKA